MAQAAFGIRFGKPDTNSIAVVGCSLVTGNITVVVDGIGSTIITLAQIGTDHTPDQAGFVGNASITGLAPYTKYTYTATQGSNSITGYFWTAPEIDDDFILIPITCDNAISFGGAPAGGYTQAKAICEANPSKGVYFLHIDDHGYWPVNELDDSGGTGHVMSNTTPATPATPLVYDYALAELSMYGLFQDATNLYVAFGHNTDRQWCMRNIPVLPQWGDWDTGRNDMGWEASVADATGSPSPAAQFTASKEVWDAFLAPFQGDSIQSSDTDSNHWAHTLGCVKIIAPDGITKCTGDGNGVDMPTADVYGSNQVSDVISACDTTDVPFKLLAMMYGIRYLFDNTVASGFQEFNSGAQHCIGGNPTFTEGFPVAAHAEYAELMTNAGGLMSKSSCNGRMGVLITVHGDHHSAKVVHHQSTAGTNNEDFYGINVGTINGSVNFRMDDVTLDVAVDGSTPEMAEGTYLQSDWWVVPFYVYGSRTIKEIEVDFMDKNGVTLWNKKFTARSMNEAVGINTNVVANGSQDGDVSEAVS